MGCRYDLQVRELYCDTCYMIRVQLLYDYFFGLSVKDIVSSNGLLFCSVFASNCHRSRIDLPIHVDMLLIIVMGYLISLLIFLLKVSSQLLSYDFSVKHEHSLAFFADRLYAMTLGITMNKVLPGMLLARESSYHLLIICYHKSQL